MRNVGGNGTARYKINKKKKSKKIREKLLQMSGWCGSTEVLKQ